MHSTRTRPAPAAARLSALLLTVFLCGGLLTVFTPGVARADDTEAISGAPCDATGGNDDRSRYTYEAGPGQQVTDCYRVENTGTLPQRVSVYATDAFNNEEGDFALLDAAAAPVDAGAWVVFEDGSSRMQFDLAPGEARSVVFALTVPADASPGDHAGGLIVSAQTPSDQILVDRRVGTRMYVRVPGDLQSLLNITGMTATYRPSLNPLAGSMAVTLTITNQGNIALAPTLVLGVETFFGADIVDRRLENLDELLPGASRTVTYDLGPTGQFVYLNARASLYSRGDQTGNLTDLPDAPQVDREAGAWALPWIVIGLAVLLMIGLLWRRWRRRRDDARAAEWMAFTEAESRSRAAAESRTPESVS